MPVTPPVTPSVVGGIVEKTAVVGQALRDLVNANAAAAMGLKVCQYGNLTKFLRGPKPADALPAVFVLPLRTEFKKLDTAPGRYGDIQSTYRIVYCARVATTDAWDDLASTALNAVTLALESDVLLSAIDRTATRIVPYESAPVLIDWTTPPEQTEVDMVGVQGRVAALTWSVAWYSS